mmetsp:Transcript_4823/g.15254  ORF Transcript_4823/g.15254 Transcript_4823/m.15254 type:complete len:437 (-) Transcript_4823:401-1711(-)
MTPWSRRKSATAPPPRSRPPHRSAAARRVGSGWRRPAASLRAAARTPTARTRRWPRCTSFTRPCAPCSCRRWRSPLPTSPNPAPPPMGGRLRPLPAQWPRPHTLSAAAGPGRRARWRGCAACWLLGPPMPRPLHSPTSRRRARRRCAKRSLSVAARQACPRRRIRPSPPSSSFWRRWTCMARPRPRQRRRRWWAMAAACCGRASRSTSMPASGRWLWGRLWRPTVWAAWWSFPTPCLGTRLSGRPGRRRRGRPSCCPPASAWPRLSTGRLPPQPQACTSPPLWPTVAPTRCSASCSAHPSTAARCFCRAVRCCRPWQAPSSRSSTACCSSTRGWAAWSSASTPPAPPPPLPPCSTPPAARAASRAQPMRPWPATAGCGSLWFRRRALRPTSWPGMPSTCRPVATRPLRRCCSPLGGTRPPGHLPAPACRPTRPPAA